MSNLSIFFALLLAFLAVFLEAVAAPLRGFLGAEVDLLPALIVYMSLSPSLTGYPLVAVLGGTWFDSLSANPLGVSVLPLFLVGFVIHRKRELLLVDATHTQFIIGALASALVPLLTLLCLVSLGQTPLLGWGSLWQWLVMTLGGGAATPACFWLFARLNQAFNYQPTTETSFRDDREIKRGRS